ncbi:MAG: hypothetical protein KJ709_07910 [Nanoarchaeota archaeon]|nr:hypothetical protein [Nanoarchaeota archaeon]
MEEKISDTERLEQGQLQCRAIIEILGQPKAHVEETLNKYLEEIKGKKDMDILEVDIAKTVPQDELFSTFAELTFWIKGPASLVGFCFDYMPSNVEIFKPMSISFKSPQLASLLNDLQARLHDVDMRLKTLTQQNTVLNKNARSLLRNLLILSLRKGPKDLPQIAKEIGLKELHLEKFMNHYIKDGLVGKEDGKYKLLRSE